MNRERLMTLIEAPHVSEKGTALAESSNQVVFRVRPEASKREIGAAIEELFSVKVREVRVVNVRGKVKRFGAKYGKRAAWKKAYIRLEPGSEIDVLGKGKAKE